MALGLCPDGLEVYMTDHSLESLSEGVFQNVVGVRREDLDERFALDDPSFCPGQRLRFHFLHFGYRRLSRKDMLKECELRGVMPGTARHMLEVCRHDRRILERFLVMAPGSVVDGRIPYAELTWPEYHERTFGVGSLRSWYPPCDRFLVYEQ